MKSELLIIEGPDCAGKTTLAKYLARGFNAFYYHCTYTELLGPAEGDYQKNVLENVEVNLANGHIVILDRFWPSEYVYSAVTRPHMHPPPWWPELHLRIVGLGGLYVFCDHEFLVEDHENNKNLDHAYNADDFARIVETYRELFHVDIHEDRWVKYNWKTDGTDINRWARRELDYDR